MKKMGLNEIREAYLSFFESKGHLRLPSFSLIPQNEKSLLLINAGMAPMKPWFSGEQIPPRRRVTTCQKCIRTPDIERVGKTARHGTFFEMLGNFSFGDYFKREACNWAWEFCTQVMELPPERLFVSVYLDDDEAYDIWTKEVGVAPSHMVRFGKSAPAPAAPARKSTSTAAKHMAAASRTAKSAATATVMLNSGTWSSRSSTTTATAIIPRSRRKTSIPAWGLSVSPASCRA